MFWRRTLLGLVMLVTLAILVHPSAGFAMRVRPARASEAALVAPPPAGVALIDVRSGPSMASAVVARMPAGASAVAVAQAQEWYQIQLPDGRAGWIHTAHVVQEPPPAWTPPVVATPPVMPSPTAPPAPAG